jgi:hypothetical protein
MHVNREQSHREMKSLHSIQSRCGREWTRMPERFQQIPAWPPHLGWRSQDGPGGRARNTLKRLCLKMQPAPRCSCYLLGKLIFYVWLTRECCCSTWYAGICRPLPSCPQAGLWLSFTGMWGQLYYRAEGHHDWGVGIRDWGNEYFWPMVRTTWVPAASQVQSLSDLFLQLGCAAGEVCHRHLWSTSTENGPVPPTVQGTRVLSMIT